ncbi:MotA/TolQ/ExbB proton channel family protein [Kamptonema formosum]|uniref:MotA/TolQ/ExbB proton channel family protein n=1 Tax=Kamptonema formosum TaxID=331992 RepID=UPI0018E2785A|nr:MotA/TolQ/ExbB proton channel family protein [Oscillatoria sp. PCC 10802]
MIWLLWLAATLTTFVAAWQHWYSANHDLNSHNDYADSTGVTSLIVVIFFLALFVNTLNTIKIYLQFKMIGYSKGLFEEHVANINLVAQNKLSIDQEFSLSLIENRLMRRESWVQLFANLLVTLGMIGTVLGLTVSMRGLSQAMESIKNSLLADNLTSPQITNSISGLGDALSGMSSAFVTTLAGAVLGGLFLKLLSHATTNLIEDLLDNIRYKAEVEVIPSLQKQIWERDLRELSEAYESLHYFINSAQIIEHQLVQYTQSMTFAGKKLESLAQGLGNQSQVDAQNQVKKLLDKIKEAISAILNTMKLLVTLLIIISVVIVGLYPYLNFKR